MFCCYSERTTVKSSCLSALFTVQEAPCRRPHTAGSDSICNPFLTTFCRDVSQFLVTSDPKPVASDQKDFLPTTSLPTKMDVVVTDNECVETSDYKLWSACKRPNNRCKGSTTGSTLSFIQIIAVAKARATANDTCHQLHTKFIISTNPNHHLTSIASYASYYPCHRSATH